MAVGTLTNYNTLNAQVTQINGGCTATNWFNININGNLTVIGTLVNNKSVIVTGITQVNGGANINMAAGSSLKTRNMTLIGNVNSTGGSTVQVTSTLSANWGAVFSANSTLCAGALSVASGNPVLNGVTQSCAFTQLTVMTYQRKPMIKEYEMSNHLGNVYVVIPGLKLGRDTTADGVTAADYYTTVPVTVNDYYAFGMNIASRSYSSASYRYGFNGKEKDPEGMGGGQSTYDYGFRIYNPALGRFLSVDPLTQSYPMLTPYQFASNMPIVAIDIDGLEAKKATESKTDTKPVARVLNSSEISLLLSNNGGFKKLKLLIELKKETTSITISGADLLEQGKGNEAFKNNLTELSKIKDVTISSGKATINLNEGEDKISLVGKKATSIIKNGAVIDFNDLKSEKKTMTDYEKNPVVDNISGKVKISGIKLDVGKFVPNVGVPDLTFETVIVPNPPKKDKDGKTVTVNGGNDSYDTQFDTGIPLANDNFAGYQDLGKKKKK